MSPPVGQFQIPGYTSPFSLDRDQYGRGIMVFLRENIPVKFLSAVTKPIEGVYIELNFHTKKSLLTLILVGSLGVRFEVVVVVGEGGGKTR